jgi:hypothetical protein
MCTSKEKLPSIVYPFLSRAWLSESELDIARRMGVTAEQYAIEVISLPPTKRSLQLMRL